MSNNTHTFHIPVMGLAYTVDSPIRVAHFGISSVISIMDDDLVEKMNAFYSKKFSLPYHEISHKISDYRAKRITAYLNLVDTIVQQKFDSFKSELLENRAALESYIALLPSKSEIRKKLEAFVEDGISIKEQFITFLEKHLTPGSIDVNIMTKVDRENFDKSGALPLFFNDAHAALRGFANSTLCSSVVLSAGMNPRLYGYFESFPDFFPDANWNLKKKITIKVSDFRSAMIQGNFFAKKGLWISEFRIESGLNCGGHAFATEGLLMGVILEEFRDKKQSLVQGMHELFSKALETKGLPVPPTPLSLRITVQGGVGTSEEHDFLLDHYKADSVGWGSPFLLVPEATSADHATRQLLADATESDLYTSEVSPLGVPFNTVRHTTNEVTRLKRIRDNKPGSPCPKKYLALNTEYGREGICTASRKYQQAKLSELAVAEMELTDEERQRKAEFITTKSCLCVGLANASLIENDIKIKGDHGVIVCPGPNIAYFNRQYTLKEMVQHIYGGKSVLDGIARPHFFIKELGMYIEYLKNEVNNMGNIIAINPKVKKMKENLALGIESYKKLFSEISFFSEDQQRNLDELQAAKNMLNAIRA